MCETWKQAARINLGTKNNMSEAPSQEDSVEHKKEMVKVPQLKVQEKIQIRTAKDEGFIKKGQRLLNLIIEDSSPVDQKEK